MKQPSDRMRNACYFTQENSKAKTRARTSFMQSGLAALRCSALPYCLKDVCRYKIMTAASAADQLLATRQELLRAAARCVNHHGVAYGANDQPVAALHYA
mmetsp:Transcript_20012/g.60467  ORF Transcript_20012/g.60467 Transcript_20012/m.60467 type:complete len:100 (-) Transcript_20012:892-1191(-)